MCILGINVINLYKKRKCRQNTKTLAGKAIADSAVVEFQEDAEALPSASNGHPTLTEDSRRLWPCPRPAPE